MRHLRVVNPEAIGDPTKTPVIEVVDAPSTVGGFVPSRRRRRRAGTVAEAVDGGRVELHDQFGGLTSCGLTLVNDDEKEMTVGLDRRGATDLRDALTAFLERGELRDALRAQLALSTDADADAGEG